MLTQLQNADYADLLAHFGRTDQMPVRTEPKGVVRFEYAQKRALWAEDHAIDLVRQDTGLIAVHFGASYSEADHKGLSGTEFQKRFRDTETLGKRPDLLLFRQGDYRDLKQDHPEIDKLLYVPDRNLPPEVMAAAVQALEVKDSVIWSADRPDRDSPAKRKGKGTEFEGEVFRKGAQITHTILGVDEFARMQRWRDHWGLPIHVAQFSLDRSYLTDFDKAERAVRSGMVEIKTQTQQWKRDGEVDARKQFWFPFSFGEEFGEQLQAPFCFPVKVRFADGRHFNEDVLLGGQWDLLPVARQMLLGVL